MTLVRLQVIFDRLFAILIGIEVPLFSLSQRQFLDAASLGCKAAEQTLMQVQTLCEESYSFFEGTTLFISRQLYVAMIERRRRAISACRRAGIGSFFCGEDCRQRIHRVDTELCHLVDR